MSAPRSTRTQPSTPAAERTDRWQAYAGCWIALVNGQVAGVGKTREDAWAAARRSRPRERVQAVHYVPPTDPPTGQGPST